MTQVTLKFTGDVWSRMKTFRMTFAFEGMTLREMLEALFQQYNVRDLVLDEHDRIIPWSRIIVNGRFSEFAGDLNAPLQTGDEVTLIHPFFVM